MVTFSSSHTCHMWIISYFSTSVMWRHLKFLHMWRNFEFPHNCHTWKAKISPHDNFSSQIILVILVTNMRSAWNQVSISTKTDQLLNREWSLFGTKYLPNLAQGHIFCDHNCLMALTLLQRSNNVKCHPGLPLPIRAKVLCAQVSHRWQNHPTLLEVRRTQVSDAMRSRNHKRASLRSFIFKNRYVLGWELPEFFLSLIVKEFESKNATEPNTTWGEKLRLLGQYRSATSIYLG